MFEYLSGKITDYFIKKFLISMLWQAMLRPAVWGMIWTIGSIVSGIVKSVSYGMHAFFSWPPIYNFIADITSVPLGFFDSLDSVANSAVRNITNSRTGEICIKCNVVGDKVTSQTFYNNIISVSVLSLFAYRFLYNADRAIEMSQTYRDDIELHGLDLQKDSSYLTASTLGVCLTVQAIAFATCCLSAISANQFPRNKFTIFATAFSAELTMNAYLDFLDGRKADLKSYSANIMTLHAAKNKAEADKKCAEDNYELAQSVCLAAKASKAAGEEHVVTAAKVIRFSSRFMDSITTDEITKISRQENFSDLGAKLRNGKMEFSQISGLAQAQALPYYESSSHARS